MSIIQQMQWGLFHLLKTFKLATRQKHGSVWNTSKISNGTGKGCTNPTTAEAAAEPEEKSTRDGEERESRIAIPVSDKVAVRLPSETPQ